MSLNKISPYLKDYLNNYIPVVDNANDDIIPATFDADKCKIISFFAPKGGVGKTTICMSTAYMLAKQGKRVVVYDCTAQRSLTTWTFGLNKQLGTESMDPNYIVNGKILKKSLYQQCVDHDLDAPKPAYAIKRAPNLYIVQGDCLMSRLDTQIVYVESTCLSNPDLRMPNVISGMPYHAIMKTANHYAADYVLLDLSSYPGALNRVLLMSSHYFFVPSEVSYMCAEMMSQTQTYFKMWLDVTKKVAPTALIPGSVFPLPTHVPEFLGVIFNNTDKRIDFVNKELILKIAKNMRADYAGSSKSNKVFIRSIPSYGELSRMSDIVHIPVPMLTRREFVYIYKQNNYDNPLFFLENCTPKFEQCVERSIASYTDIIKTILDTQ